jgi:hypothetical protein
MILKVKISIEPHQYSAIDDSNNLAKRIKIIEILEMIKEEDFTPKKDIFGTSNINKNVSMQYLSMCETDYSYIYLINTRINPSLLWQEAIFNKIMQLYRELILNKLIP